VVEAVPARGYAAAGQAKRRPTRRRNGPTQAEPRPDQRARRPRKVHRHLGRRAQEHHGPPTRSSCGPRRHCVRVDDFRPAPRRPPTGQGDIAQPLHRPTGRSPASVRARTRGAPDRMARRSHGPRSPKPRRTGGGGPGRFREDAVRGTPRNYSLRESLFHFHRLDVTPSSYHGGHVARASGATREAPGRGARSGPASRPLFARPTEAARRARVGVGAKSSAFADARFGPCRSSKTSDDGCLRTTAAPEPPSRPVSAPAPARERHTGAAAIPHDRIPGGRYRATAGATIAGAALRRRCPIGREAAGGACNGAAAAGTLSGYGTGCGTGWGAPRGGARCAGGMGGRRGSGFADGRPQPE